MTWQMYAEKMETQLILNNNAFALIQRDDNGFPVALFPIVASSVQALYNKAGELLLQFWLPNGSTWTFAYTDVIHLRNDYNENDVFGTPPALRFKASWKSSARLTAASSTLFATAPGHRWR